jgi:hypothetical protein
MVCGAGRAWGAWQSRERGAGESRGPAMACPLSMDRVGDAHKLAPGTCSCAPQGAALETRAY